MSIRHGLLLCLTFGIVVAARLIGGNLQGQPPAASVWLPISPEVRMLTLEGVEDAPSLTAEAAILIENNSGTILYSKNADVRRAPASTTKILTALLALEQSGLDEVVTVSRRAASTPGSSAHLVTGQEIRMRDLLHGLLLRSGNDAAVAIAEHIAGSVEAFASLMNARAAELGAQDSRFQNPHGLDAAGHFSTARDLARLARAALLHPVFAEIVATESYAPEGASGSWRNTNRLLWSFEGAEGIKTGTTGKAGYCLVAAASRDGMQLISVVLGSRDRWSDSTRLLNYGFNQFHLLKIADRGDALAELPLAGFGQPVVAVAAERLLTVVPDRYVNHITTRLVFSDLRLPIRRNEVLGHYQVLLDGEPIAEVPLVASRSVGGTGLFGTLWRWLIGR